MEAGRRSHGHGAASQARLHSWRPMWRESSGTIRLWMATNARAACWARGFCTRGPQPAAVWLAGALENSRPGCQGKRASRLILGHASQWPRACGTAIHGLPANPHKKGRESDFQLGVIGI